MDGKRRWMDNVFIERLWRSLKCECAFLWEFVSGLEAGEKIGSWFTYYHEDRCHLALVRNCPLRRRRAARPNASARIIALPRVGGLHRRYEWDATA